MRKNKDATIFGGNQRILLINEPEPEPEQFVFDLNFISFFLFVKQKL